MRGREKTPVPEYKLRRSRRARYLRLQVSAEEGLRVVAPLSCTESQIIDFIQNKQSWIEKQLEKVRPLKQAIISEQNTIPRSLHLRAIDQCYRIEVFEKVTGQGRRKWSVQEDKLVLAVSSAQPADIQTILRTFVRQQARQFLNQELAELCQHHGLVYQGCTIRRQKTRWGSCSSRGNISLNEQLMFFPRPLMSHVLLHELAHTVHRNHGPGFYRLLSKLDPDLDSHRRQLRQAAQYIPLWYQVTQ
jgi:predicted metal-dependent hydrolase